MENIKDKLYKEIERKALELGGEAHYSNWKTVKNDIMFLSIVCPNGLDIECGSINLKTGEYKILDLKNSKVYNLLSKTFIQN